MLRVGLFITLLGASAGWITPSNIAAAQGLNSITGYVSDDQRNRLPDLQVELLNDSDSVLQRTKTDSSGLFVFRRLNTGIFQVRVQTGGTIFVGQTHRVQIDRAGATEQLDIVLVSKNSAAKTTPGVVFVQKIPPEARKLYDRGVALLEKDKQRKEGAAALESAIQIFPLYFDALQSLGSEYVLQQNYDKAIPLLTKAIEVNREAFPSLYALSLAQYNLKLLPEAIDSMRRAIALDPRSVNANLWLGMLLRQTGGLTEAEPYLKAADKLAASKSPEVHWQLALLFNQLKRYKEAADELELFLKVEPEAKDTDLIKRLIKQFREKSNNNVKQ